MVQTQKHPRVCRLEEASVLIAGGTAGVGLAAAGRFAEAGTPRIMLMGRNSARGEESQAQLAARFPAADIRFIAADANDVADVSRVCAAAHAQFGSIDVMLCSTVGAAAPALLKSIPLEEIESVLVAQALGPMAMSRGVLPYMVEQGGGVILNVASDAAKLATPGETVIGAAMAAIVMFSRALAVEAKRDGIRVNALTPSLIEGTLTHARMQQSPFASKLFAKAAQAAHLGVAVAEDLAELAVFLASPAAAKITGQAISANGGISAA